MAKRIGCFSSLFLGHLERPASIFCHYRIFAESHTKSHNGRAWKGLRAEVRAGEALRLRVLSKE